jgi:hypothetical protein
METSKTLVPRGQFLIDYQMKIQDAPAMYWGKLHRKDVIIVESPNNNYNTASTLASTKAYLPVLAHYFDSTTHYRAISPLTAKPLKSILRHEDIELTVLKNIITSAIETFTEIEKRNKQVKWALDLSFIGTDMRFCVLETSLAAHQSKTSREDFSVLLETIVSCARCSDVNAVIGDEMFKQFISALKNSRKPLSDVICLGKFLFNPMKCMRLITAVVDTTKKNKTQTLRRSLTQSSGFPASVTAKLDPLVKLEPHNRKIKPITDFYQLCKFVRNKYAHLMSRNHVRQTLALIGAEGEARGAITKSLLEFVEKAAPGFQFLVFENAARNSLRNTTVQQCLE